MRRVLPLAALLVSVTWVSVAHAQFIAPIRNNVGPGFKLRDDLVFHAGLNAEGRFDSNPFRKDTNVSSSGYLRLVGHLGLETTSAERLQDSQGDDAPPPARPTFYAAADLDIAFWQYLSEAADFRNGVELDFGTDLKLFPQSMVSFGLEADYVRSYPGWAIQSNIGRDTIRALVPFIFTPGGGRLKFRLHYGINFDLFETGKDGRKFSQGNKYFHEIRLEAKWRLLPKSAIFFEAIQQFVTYMESGNQDSMPMRLFLGFRGLITPRFRVVLRVGYGNGFYQDSGLFNDESYNMVLGQVELGYEIGPTAKLKVGYEHSFNDHFVASYYTNEKAYLGVDWWIMQRFLIHAKADYIYRNYDGFANTYWYQDVKNHLFAASAAFDYRVLDWLFLGIGYDLEVRRLAEQTVTPGFSVVNENNLVFRPYVRHQAMLKVGVTY